MKKIRMQTIMFLASFVVVLTLFGSVATGGIVFLDDFEDGSATDGAPVTWTPLPGMTGSFEVIDGDFLMTRPSNIEEMYSAVNQYTLADTSIRTQARLIGSGAWWLGLLARGNPTDYTTYALLLFNNARLEIWRFGPPGPHSWMLAGADVGIDPRAQDVLMRFDVIGNELSAWAWREGDPMPVEPQVTAVHSEWATGNVGIAADLGWRLSNNDAIFRYVEVYEPIPPTPDFNGDGIVDAADMCMMIEYWGTDEPSYDIAPEPWGDGIIDVQDLIVLAEHLFEEIFPPELIAYWKLDEAEGDTAYDSAGGNYGTLRGNPIWQPDSGQVTGALELDGIDDYVETDFVLDPADGAFSVFAWIQGGASGQVIISQKEGTNWLGVDPFDGKLTGLGFSNDQSSLEPLVSEFMITDGNWHNIGIVVSANQSIRFRSLYVDGTRAAFDIQPVTLLPSDGGMYIGTGKNLEAGSFFSGLIDDVRIYDRALRSEEIAALAQ
jgi:hypothetical protein